ncbi:5-bromo-4-chloroindolyl phosphate hydrolysis family protein [Oscillospiraceae bacterium OttesenSCG-928-F05]|nr:5-bromo-4-chloroindolyl phosphate hydrolysis family protein [Oscillospiraceae bacterium OttesenSCG-928-F05]
MASWKKTARSVGSKVSAWLQLFFGVLLTAGFGIWMLIAAVRVADGAGRNAALTAVMLSGAGLGLALLSLGLRKLKMFRAFDLVSDFMGDSAQEDVEVLAARLRMTVQQTVSVLHRMIKLGLFPGATINLEFKQFVASPSKFKRPDAVDQNGTIYMPDTKKSPVPYYAVGAMWLLSALFMPMYRVGDFILVAALSVAAYLLCRKIFPDTLTVREEPRFKPIEEKPARSSGDPEFDALIETATGHMRRMAELNLAIVNKTMNGQVDELLQVGRQIMAFIQKTPQKRRQIRQFFNYYLPTTVKLLENYSEMSRQSVRGENITETLRKTEEMMGTVVEAFRKELDELFFDKAMDISTDIEVMKSMLKSEGLDGRSSDNDQAKGG